jgi:haloacetate dehalogenase
MGAESHADYRAAIHDPATVHGMIDDYRAGLGIDSGHHMAEEAPEELAKELLRFLGE